jgi:hypothetical protein
MYSNHAAFKAALKFALESDGKTIPAELKMVPKSFQRSLYAPEVAPEKLTAIAVKNMGRMFDIVLKELNLLTPKEANAFFNAYLGFKPKHAAKTPGLNILLNFKREPSSDSSSLNLHSDVILSEWRKLESRYLNSLMPGEKRSYELMAPLLDHPLFFTEENQHATTGGELFYQFGAFVRVNTTRQATYFAALPSATNDMDKNPSADFLLSFLSANFKLPSALKTYDTNHNS